MQQYIVKDAHRGRDITSCSLLPLGGRWGGGTQKPKTVNVQSITDTTRLCGDSLSHSSVYEGGGGGGGGRLALLRDTIWRDT